MNRSSIARASQALLLCVLTLLIGSAGAQQTLQSYDVELVIFRNMMPVSSNELLSVESAAPAAPASTALADEETNPASASNVIPEQRSLDTFPPLNPGKYKLSGIEDSLRRSGNKYQVIAHIGWTQPGFARTDAHYLAVDPLVAAGAGLGGRISLTRGRYLHLALDMTYQTPEDAGQKFLLRQERRMRSNERHYIDHPKFGVIALVLPST